MKNILFILSFIPALLFGQINYNITVSSTNAWFGNLFFQQGGNPPGWTGPGQSPKPVKILDVNGVEIFSENWQKKGWDFKVNENNKISYYDRISKGWFVMDSLQNEVDSVYCANGFEADNHDFIALEDGGYVLFAYDVQPYAMDTVVEDGDPNALIELEGNVESSYCNPVWSQNYFGINLNFYNANSSAFSIGDKINVGGIDYWIDAIVLPTNCNSNVALIYVSNNPYTVDGSWTSIGGMLQNPVTPQDSWIIGECYYNPGCTNPAYVEYDPNADFDDGSCQTLAVLGCTDSTAINFNPWADNNDGSCILPPSCSFTEFECQVTLTLDNYPGETGWLVTADNGTSVDTIYQVLPGTYNFGQAGSTLNTNFCVPANLSTFITFTLTDSYGDGLAGSTTGGVIDGDVIVENISCGDTIFELINPAFGSSISSDGTYSTPWPMLCNGLLVVPGCMDPQYQEYNPLADVDDGSCQTLHIYGCMDSTSFNYDPNATSPEYISPVQYQVILEDDGGDGWGNSFIGLRQGNQLWDFKLDPGVFVDTFFIDLTVDVYQTPLEMFYFEIPLPQQNPSQIQIQTIQNSVVVKNDYGIIIEEGTYPWANGNKLKKFNGPQDIYTGTPFGGYNCIPKVFGCTDSTAHVDSYNPNANTDDGSCFYNPGCNNAGFVEFWEADSTVVDYWSIDYCYTPAIFGCTDSTMLNYNPSANVDNGTCIEMVMGCTDVSAYNYNSSANVDDGSCLYDAGCIGGPGVPYWLNDTCYAWVISVDPYCCDNSWDAFCQAEYNFCQDGTPLNLDEASEDTRKIIVYPNPTQETINIKHNLNDDVIVEIRDVMGKLILTSRNESKINVSSLTTGLYNLTVKSNQIIVTKRIIKQ